MSPAAPAAPGPTSPPIAGRRLRGDFLVTSALTAVSMGFAFLRMVLLVRYFGTDAATDAFMNANTWFRVFLEDMPNALIPVVMPAYLHRLTAGTEGEARAFLNRFMIRRGAAFLGVLALIALTSPWLVDRLTPGLPPGARGLYQRFLLAVLAVAPLLFLATVLRVYYEAHRRFALSAQFRSTLWLLTALGIVALAGPLGIWSAVAGIWMGVFGGFLVMAVPYWRGGDRGAIARGSAGAAARAGDATGRSLLVLVASLAVQRSAAFVDQYYGSMIGPGAFTVVNLASTIVSVPVALVAQPLGTVLVPRLLALRVAGDPEGLRRLFLRGVVAVAGVSGVFALGLVVGAGPMARLGLSGRGGGLAAAQAADVLRAYAPVVVFLSLQTVLTAAAAALGARQLLVWTPVGAVAARILLLSHYGGRLNMVGLAHGAALYHGLWVACLVGYFALLKPAASPEAGPAARDGGRPR